MKVRTNPPVFFEMLRSFTSLSETLNLSHTVSELGITRQTVRRHIDHLERIKGYKLFEVTGRKYNLTEAGVHSLPEAKMLLERVQAWLGGQARIIDGLARSKIEKSATGWFYAQQHPVNNVWSMGPPLLQKGLEVWSLSKSQLEHRSMKSIRPYLVVYRKHEDNWLCVDVGAKSSYATWLGWVWAKSAIGCSYMEDPLNSNADQFMVRAYEVAFQSGSIWYDHICAQFPRKEGGKLYPVCYQRLVFACTFPDGKPAVAALVARTDQIEINGFDAQKVVTDAKSNRMEFAL